MIFISWCKSPSRLAGAVFLSFSFCFGFKKRIRCWWCQSSVLFVFNLIKPERVTADFWWCFGCHKMREEDMDSNSWAFPSIYLFGFTGSTEKKWSSKCCVINFGFVCVGEREGGSGWSLPSVGVGLTLAQLKRSVPETRCLEALLLRTVSLSSGCSTGCCSAYTSYTIMSPATYFICFATKKCYQIWNWCFVFKEFRGAIKEFLFSYSHCSLTTLCGADLFLFLQPSFPLPAAFIET